MSPTYERDYGLLLPSEHAQTQKTAVFSICYCPYRAILFQQLQEPMFRTKRRDFKALVAWSGSQLR